MKFGWCMKKWNHSGASKPAPRNVELFWFHLFIASISFWEPDQKHVPTFLAFSKFLLESKSCWKKDDVTAIELKSDFLLLKM